MGGLIGPIEEFILIFDYLKPLDWNVSKSMIPYGGKAGNSVNMEREKHARDCFALQWKGEAMTGLLTQVGGSAYN